MPQWQVLAAVFREYLVPLRSRWSGLYGLVQDTLYPPRNRSASYTQVNTRKLLQSA